MRERLPFLRRQRCWPAAPPRSLGITSTSSLPVLWLRGVDGRREDVIVISGIESHERPTDARLTRSRRQFIRRREAVLGASLRSIVLTAVTLVISRIARHRLLRQVRFRLGSHLRAPHRTEALRAIFQILTRGTRMGSIPLMVVATREAHRVAQRFDRCHHFLLYRFTPAQELFAARAPQSSDASARALLEAAECRVEPVQRELATVERKRVREHLEMDLRIFMSREADMRTFPCWRAPLRAPQPESPAPREVLLGIVVIRAAFRGFAKRSR